VAGEVGRDVAELSAVGDDGFVELGPALFDVGGDEPPWVQERLLI
jgi:hypothetical protein